MNEILRINPVQSVELNNDLVVYYSGFEKCTPEQSYGPAFRDHYLLHYVEEGKGEFHANKNVYKLSKNDLFLIFPEQTTYYGADSTLPWSYYWIGFNGRAAEYYIRRLGFSTDSPIIRIKDAVSVIESFNLILCDCLKNSSNIDILTQSCFYKILFNLAEQTGNIENSGINEVSRFNYINHAIKFIERYYSQTITVRDIAGYVGIHRGYLYLLFKENLKMSPQEYLINYRLDKACRLMHNPDYSIGDISRSVGFKDPLHFSKVFSKFKGSSPRKYRDSYIKEYTGKNRFNPLK